MNYIETTKSPGAIGPYSQAILFNNMLFTSGQLGINMETGELGENISDQTNFVLQNLENILKEAGFSLANVIKTTVFLQDLSDFKTVNDVYAGWFADHKPARSTIQVAGLPKNALIEIEAVAIK